MFNSVYIQMQTNRPVTGVVNIQNKFGRMSTLIQYLSNLEKKSLDHIMLPNSSYIIVLVHFVYYIKYDIIIADDFLKSLNVLSVPRVKYRLVSINTRET